MTFEKPLVSFLLDGVCEVPTENALCTMVLFAFTLDKSSSLKVLLDGVCEVSTESVLFTMVLFASTLDKSSSLKVLLTLKFEDCEVSTFDCKACSLKELSADLKVLELPTKL